MGHESPVMKAWREFAMADPENCDQEWAACIALMKKKESASASPPRNSPSPIHNRVHDPALVVASSSMRSTASLSGPSSVVSSPTNPTSAATTSSATRSTSASVRSSTCTPVSTVAPSSRAPNSASSIAGISESAATTTTPATYASHGITKDNLSPGARRIYDYIMGHSDYLNGDSMAPTSTASPCVPCNAGSTDGIPVFVTGTPETDLFSVTPTTCSAECPSPGTSVHAAAPVHTATPKLSTTTGGVVPELPEPEVANESLDMDAMVDIAPMASICLPGGPDHITGGEHPVALSLTTWSVPPEHLPSHSIETPPSLMAQASNVFSDAPIVTAFVPWLPPRCTHARATLIYGKELLHLVPKRGNEPLVTGSQGKRHAVWFEVTGDSHPFERMKVVKLKPPWPPSLAIWWLATQRVRPDKSIGEVFAWLWITLFAPWPPQWYVSFQDAIQYKNVTHGFVLESMQLMLCAMKTPGPPPFSNSNTVVRIKGRTTPEIRLGYCSSQGADLSLFSSEACQIFNLISGDWYLFNTGEFEWELATLTLNIFSLRIQCAQLQLTPDSLTDQICHVTHSLMASTRVDALLDLLLTSRAICVFWIWCCNDNLHWYPGVTVQHSTHSSAFLIGLNEEVQQHYTYEKVLPIAVCQGWISQLILQGSPHYFDLMRWSFSLTQLQSAFWFCNPGQIIFSCCALVQWEIPWINCLVSMKSWFHYCSAEHESLDSCGNFQWTIARLFSFRLLRDLFLLSPTQWVFVSSFQKFRWKIHVNTFDLALVAWNHVGCSTWMKGSVPTWLLKMYNMLSGLASTCFRAAHIVLEHWFIPWDPDYVLVQHILHPTKPWLLLRVSRAVGISSRHHQMGEFACLAVTCELHYSISVVDKFPAALDWVWCMRCMKLETDRPHQCVVFLQSKPPRPYFDPTISSVVAEYLHTIGVSLEFNQFLVGSSHGSMTYDCLDFVRKLMEQQISWLLGCSFHQFITEDATYFGSQLLEWNIPSYPCLVILLNNWLQMQPVGDPCNFYAAFLFSWDVTSTVFPVACIMQCGSKLVPWEITRSEDDCLPCTSKQVLLSWDPGGSILVLTTSTDSNWIGTQLQYLYLTWDPGGYTPHRLEGKPKLKEGGLSATYLSTDGLDSGPLLLGLGLLKARRGLTTNTQQEATKRSAWNWMERRLRPRRLARRVLRV